MITVCLGGIPVLWAAYALAMAAAGFGLREVLLYIFWCPFFSYLAVIATEAGMVDLKDLKPHLLRLMVSQSEMLKLVEQRKGLQTEVRRLVKAYGPKMGKAYYERSVSSSDLAALSSGGVKAKVAAVAPVAGEESAASST